MHDKMHKQKMANENTYINKKFNLINRNICHRQHFKKNLSINFQVFQRKLKKNSAPSWNHSKLCTKQSLQIH